jgi:hypothetical protein
LTPDSRPFFIGLLGEQYGWAFEPEGELATVDARD